MTRLRPTVLLAALIAAALALAGCMGGDDDSGEISGIAEITPANASLYADAIIRPEGEQKEQLDSFLSVVFATDNPGQELLDLIEKEAAAGGSDTSYEEDVEPWLGDQAGVFTIGTEDDPPAVVAVESSDTEQGVELLRTESKKLQTAEYQGISYEIDENGEAFGAIGDFVAFGDESAFRAAIEASEGESLADADRFKTAVEDVPEDAVGRAVLNVTSLADSAAEGEGVPSGVAGDALTQLGVEGSLVASAVPGDKSLSLDIAGLGTGGGEPPKLLGELPFDAFLALGVSDVGGKVEDIIGSIEEIGIPGLSRDVIAAGLSAEAGIDLDEDLLSWLGDVAFFIRGTDPAALEGALVFESKDDIAAARTLDKLRGVAETQGLGSEQPLELGGAGGNGFELQTEEFSQPLNVVQRNGRVVIGLGDAATEQALNPTETLSNAPEFKAAAGSLGAGGPAFYVSIPKAIQVLGEQAVEDPEYKKIQPFLERLAFITGGNSEGALRFVLSAE